MANLAGTTGAEMLRRYPKQDQVRHPDGDVQLPSVGSNLVETGAPGLEPSNTPGRKGLQRPTTSVPVGDRLDYIWSSIERSLRNDHGKEETLAALENELRGLSELENDPISIRILAAAQRAPQQHTRPSRRSDNRQVSNQTVMEEDSSENIIFSRSETRPISQEQLLAGVKGVYVYSQRSNQVTPEEMRARTQQARIQQARLEAETLKDRINRKKDELKVMQLEEFVTAQDQRLPAEARSPLNTSYRARERRFLPLEINGRPAHALPDTGITGNAICEDYALDIGATIERPPSKHHFVNAKNQPFESVGTTRLTVSIPEALSKNCPRREWVCSFAVVKQLAAPLVLGNQFLRKTEALVSLAHLMVRKTISVMGDKIDRLRKVWMFMHMNLPTQKLGCSLGAEPAFAALDSGSDIDAISLTYAKLRKWRIKPLPEGEGYVLLANNELVKLSGYVETTLGIRGGCIRKRFYVLDGLVCDAVLGDPTIEALDIFNKFQSSLVDTTAAEDMDPFHMIQWVEEIDQIEHELEELLAERPSAAFSGTAKPGWISSIRKGARRKGKPAEGEGIVNGLSNMLEDVEVRSANWRRAAEAELLRLTGDEHTRKKEEFDKRKKQNDGLRDKIRQNINARLQMPKPKSRLGSGQPRVAANTAVMF
ncbi:hypothetical protein INS49_007168 [Diaporthe citri]|uniref:uncharacterized protein n=1 Tax=Diaporthe citri TaxID=83186 RepID=UPI001C7E7C64|nr:uncharacterized protein INS49_007168 [Diaporthe citri]KAG6365557.1 hypothetical protein INS49_007168 [Diaporthe citri]